MKENLEFFQSLGIPATVIGIGLVAAYLVRHALEFFKVTNELGHKRTEETLKVLNDMGETIDSSVRRVVVERIEQNEFQKATGVPATYAAERIAFSAVVDRFPGKILWGHIRSARKHLVPDGRSLQLSMSLWDKVGYWAASYLCAGVMIAAFILMAVSLGAVFILHEAGIAANTGILAACYFCMGLMIWFQSVSAFVSYRILKKVLNQPAPTDTSDQASLENIPIA